ncbi:hypothetical protein ASD65_10170 [Microbacterium sp. Root61]|uniref:alpha-L-rhamnosidase-related protein n=1 Tax=Microbacterium sp. Root61 TaxID=1736570 RepID=UPI0006FCB3CF|nr:family 78 glycoside hydrolase catalytic domain [Microbacterium sp. Root61]KRA24745.1 hypothetical protein ASD65_10170 [Microbacterium sp. Root61]
MTQPESPFGPWTGEWISAAQAVADGLHRIGFRRDFTLADPPGAVPLRISADSRYVLWVNGQEIGRGPVRGQPYRWTYDDYDIGAALVEGLNTIAVLVTFYGHDNAIWQRARVSSGLGSSACLIVDLPYAWAALASGPAWTARPMTAWSTLPGAGMLASLPVEIVDQRELDVDWLLPAGDTTEFLSAVPAQALHPGGSRRSRPPAYPYGALRPRGIARLDGDLVSPASATLVRPGEQPSRPPIDSVQAALSGVAALAERSTTESAHRSSPDDPLLWQFDFGRVLSGFVEFAFDAPAGTVFDLAYLERPHDPAQDARYVPRAGARIIARGGPGRFHALETNGVRVAAVLITPPMSADVRIEELRVREHVYPFAPGASFASSDSELERLWHAGVRTVQVNSSDAFTDCPTREQRAWVGDGVVHLGVHLVANRDWRLVERYLDMCDSPRADGMLPMSVAGDIESDSRYTIPDWSLHWLHGLWTYARASHKLDVVRTHLPTAERMLTWFEQYADVDGVLADVPEWGLVDWASVFTSGRSAILTALWVRGLREFAELCDAVGNMGSARWARDLVARTEIGFECFWDPNRAVYVDHIVDGIQMPAVSQAANAAAIVADLVSAERRTALARRITDESHLVSRGWNAASPDRTLAEKVQDRAAGVQRIDWDVRRWIVRAEPFFSSVVHDAVAHAGCADLLPRLLRRWLRFLVDGYDTFGECWDWGTPAHGWSSTPTSDLVTHVLGVSPVGLETDVYRIAPAAAGIEWMRATVPTRAGLLSIELVGGQLTVDSPLPVRIQTWRGEVLALPAGGHRIDLAVESNSGEPVHERA